MNDPVKILLIDDDPAVLSAAAGILRHFGYEVHDVRSPGDAVYLLQRRSFDLAMIDQFLGPVTGVDLMPTFSRLDPTLHFIILTGRPDVDLAVTAMREGATDFLSKPFTAEDLQRSVEGVLRRKRQRLRKAVQLSELDRRVRELSAERSQHYVDVLESFSRAVENRDHGTYGHSQRVSEYSCAIAVRLGLAQEDVESVRAAALLHDIGKIGIGDNILGKVGPLTEEETAIIRSHPERGANILQPIKQMEAIVPAVLHHHEHFDGSGYPACLAGHNIPLLARIIAVADTSDAILSTRPYRRAETIEHVIRELIRCSGTQFDPGIARVMIEVLGAAAPPDGLYRGASDRAVDWYPALS